MNKWEQTLLIRGFSKSTITTDFKKGETLEVFHTTTNLVFIIKDKMERFSIGNFIDNFRKKPKYCVISLKEETIDDGAHYPITITEELLDKKLVLCRNMTFILEEVRDFMELNTTKEKDITLSYSKKRFIKKWGVWEEALSEEESNEYFKSSVLMGPFGVHYLTHKPTGVLGFSNIIWFLIYFFTGGIYGISWLESLLMLTFGKKVPKNGESLKGLKIEKVWVIPKKTKENWGYLVIGIPISVAMVLISMFIVSKGGGWLGKLGSTIVDSIL